MLNKLLRIFVIDILIFGGGVIVIFLLVLENRIAFPVTGINYPLDHVMEWTLVLWVWSRFGHYLKDYAIEAWTDPKAFASKMWRIVRRREKAGGTPDHG